MKKNGITLCKDNDQTEEIKILRDALKNNFNLDTIILNKKGNNETIYERIYIKKEGFEKIKISLLFHLHDSILYKNKWRKIDKQNSEDIESDSRYIMDIFYIGGS